MDFQQIRDFVNPAVAQATGMQEVENLSMPVPVAYVPVQLVIDGALSLTSENPVQNKVIAVAIQQLDGRITAIEGQFSEGVTEAVNNWLAAHPEATTTVLDGAISYAKLDANLQGKADQIDDLTSAFEEQLYAEKCPFIKELYINEEGISAGIAVVNSIDHNATTGVYRVRFADAELTNIIANATFDINHLYEPAPIMRQNIIRGYVMINWAGFEGTGTEIRGTILDKSFSLDYSPTIARILADNVIDARIDSLETKTARIRTVGTGCQYQTIQAAVDASNSGDIIIIYPGTYYEAVSFPRKSLCLIGTVRDDVILQYDNNDYNLAALEMCQGVLMNMTVRAFDNGGTPGSSGKAYALHCDFQSAGIVGGMLYCENVKFINENYNAVGMGLRGQAHYEFVNCEFNCLTDYSALYAHDANNTNYDIANQSVSFKNCTFINNSSTRPTISMVTQEKQIGVASIEWQRNIVVNKNSGGLITMEFYQGHNIGGGGWMDSSDWVLLETSALNTVQTMNYGAS